MSRASYFHDDQVTVTYNVCISLCFLLLADILKRPYNLFVLKVPLNTNQPVCLILHALHNQ